jgi:formylglycine-generating enzyme required for sulfatase activity
LPGGHLSARLHVEEGGRKKRSLDDADFPVAIGGNGAPVPIEGSAFPLAWLGLSEGEVFVQAAAGATVYCNGTRLGASHWLRDGDVLRVGSLQVEVRVRPDGAHLSLQPLSDANPTEPPVVLVPPPRDGAAARVPPVAESVLRPTPYIPRAVELAPAPRRELRPTTILTALLLGLALLLLSLFATSRAVVVEVTPAPDHLRLRGGFPVVPLGSRFLARPGRYTVEAEKEGYRRLLEAVEVKDAAQPPFRFSLVPLPGRLAVASAPVSGATVRVDGREVGQTPLGGLELEAGEHEVRVQAEGYVEGRVQVAIQGQGVGQRVFVTLVPNSAPLTFDSVPPGATVRVDGRALGRTPLTAAVSAGSRSIDVERDGYRPESRRVEVVAGRPLRLAPFRLAPKDGTLALGSDPAGATVSVDGAWKGETPVELALAPDRAQELRVVKAGYEAAALTVTLGKGERREQVVRLVAQLGEVVVKASPADAELLVDGQPRGRAEQTLRLAATPHEIEIRREGYETERRTVTPRPAFSQMVKVALKSAAQVREEAMPPVLRTAQGHELHRVDGGRIVMGAPRREPGRRANEPLRDVELVRPFYIATREVSNLQYRQFETGHSSGSLGDLSLDVDSYPVVRLSWEQAAAYCNWLSQREGLPPAYVERGGRLVGATPLTTGYRLPTEAEWARVARYASGGSALKYSWGMELPVPKGAGNFADASARALLAQVLPDYDDGFPVSAPVDSFSPNALGLFHLGDNVAEWAHDFYTLTPSTPGQVARDPTGPPEGEYHVIRGASFMHSTVTELRLSFRDYGKDPRPDVGFRVARYAQ